MAWPSISRGRHNWIIWTFRKNILQRHSDSACELGKKLYEGSSIVMSCSVGHRYGSDLALLWLWPPIQPFTWELPYAVGIDLKNGEKKKKRCMINRNFWLFEISLNKILLYYSYFHCSKYEGNLDDKRPIYHESGSTCFLPQKKCQLWITAELISFLHAGLQCHTMCCGCDRSWPSSRTKSFKLRIMGNSLHGSVVNKSD